MARALVLLAVTLPVCGCGGGDDPGGDGLPASLLVRNMSSHEVASWQAISTWDNDSIFLEDVSEAGTFAAPIPPGGTGWIHLQEVHLPPVNYDRVLAAYVHVHTNDLVGGASGAHWWWNVDLLALAGSELVLRDDEAIYRER